MKLILPMTVLIAALALAWPVTSTQAAQEAPQPAEPQTAAEAAKTGTQAVQAAKQGLWWNFSALAIMILMYGAKTLGLLKKMGRWRYVAVPILSIAASLLAAFQGGVSIEVALSVLTTGLATAKIQELWEHGILGKPHGAKS